MDFALVLPAGELLRAYALFASPLTLLVGSMCGPPAAISCSYRDNGVPCSVVGPLLWLARRSELPDYWLPDYCEIHNVPLTVFVRS